MSFVSVFQKLAAIQPDLRPFVMAIVLSGIVLPHHAFAENTESELPAVEETVKSDEADKANADYDNLVNYNCANERSLQVRYIADSDEEYALLITGGEVQKRLELSRSGSGVLYTDGTLNSLEELQWHTKANEGLLIKQGKTLKCIESEADDTPETNQE